MTHRRLSALAIAARTATERGFAVFPLAPGDKPPAVSRWEERATTDPARIVRCWAHAPYNVGIACGPSRLVVIDLDTPKHLDDTPPPESIEEGVTDGMDVFAALCERHGQPFPTDTFTVRTGRGGQHLYFTAPHDVELRNTGGKLGWKVDTRAAGGYVVAAGSSVNGQPYTVVHGASPAPLPPWLAALLTPPPLPPQRPVTVALKATDRHGAYLKTAVEAEIERVTSSADDEHNQDLYRAAVALGQLVAGGELSETDVYTYLSAAAEQVGQTPREIPRTIASGLRAGARRPRTVRLEEAA
ncbi:bifunctional DNA primase/polymerase [Streptomyces sp. SBT349]|uniref:bifunctional DNA primase/polymerase n=1 Tax=Streptomyces sp. SBT349 TaxID=1580539 RepID=UPI000A5E495E|nr:bifunctional DNA primase/polymerase [Streptomyces sp. SBT349]